MAFPSNMYRDPMESAMRAEESSCKGCRHLEKLLSREFCGKGKRTLRKCRKYDEKKGG